jgi:diguanylate cyclase (GGDEF)-like protein
MQQSETPSQASRQLRTLVVEADTEARQLLELALSVRGQAVTACQDAASARTELSEASFPLIVLSRFLPDGDALQFVRELRGSEAGMARATIVVISSIPTTEDQAELLTAGADDYIAWPADTDLLRERFDAAERQALSEPRRTSTQHAAADEPFLILHPDGSIKRAAAGSEQILGFPPDAIAGVNAFSFIDPSDAPEMLALITEAFARPTGSQPREIRVRRAGDTWRSVTLRATNALDISEVGGVALYLLGPEARLSDGEDATRAALLDPVTVLPNRTLFLDRIDHAVTRGARKSLPVVVVTVDFTVSDNSNVVSDGLVAALAQRLRSCLRTSDTAARLGPLEFGLLLEEIVDPENVRIVAERVLESMHVPFYESGAEVQLTPNIGIVVSSAERYRAIDLLRASTTARTWARVQGSGQYVMFDESMDADAPATPEPDTNTAAPPVSVTVPAAPTAARSADARFDALQERLDTLEQLIRDLSR